MAATYWKHDEATRPPCDEGNTREVTWVQAAKDVQSQLKEQEDYQKLEVSPHDGISCGRCSDVSEGCC